MIQQHSKKIDNVLEFNLQWKLYFITYYLYNRNWYALTETAI